MNFGVKKCILCCTILLNLSLFACTNGVFYSDTTDNDIKIPLVSLGDIQILDLENIPKYDTSSLLPAPLKKAWNIR